MTVKEQLTLVSGLAVILAGSALMPIYDGKSWVGSSLGAVLVVVVSGLLSRRLGAPRPLQPVIALLLLVAFLLVVFTGSTLAYGIVPTSRTLDLVNALVTQGQNDVQSFGPPVPVHRGLTLMTAAGVGAVAVLVDLVAVVLDRPAVAGLPLLTLVAVPSAVLPDGVSGQYFVLAAVGWLALLLVEGSERVGRWGTPMRSSLPGARVTDDSSLGRVGRRIGFAAVGAAVLIPWATPGLDHRLVGNGNGGGPGAGSGGAKQAQTYNPITKLTGYLTQKKVTFFQYVTTDPQPDYIRMTTLDKYADGVWSADKLRADPNDDQAKKGIATAQGENGPHRDLTMNVALSNKALQVRWLPAPYGPTAVNVGPSWLWEQRSQTIFSAGDETTDLTNYKVTASRALPVRESLQAASLDDVDGDVLAHYGQPLEVAPYVKSVTDGIVKGKTSEYDRAVAIQDYFGPANGYSYSLSASVAEAGQDKLEGFLKGKKGFCEQYATAMAVMLRVAGIPSRVAVGFTAGTKSVDKNGQEFWTVTTQEAHAWPEAWFAGTGWVRFEPTPAAVGATVPSYTSEAPSSGVPNGGGTPTTQPSANPSASASLSKQLRDALEKDNQPGSDITVSGGGGNGPSFWLIAPVAAALLLVLPFLLTVLRRRQRWTRPGPLTAWAQLQDDATDVGYTWRGADSPRAAAARLAADVRLSAPALEALRVLAAATERARYAPEGRGGDDSLSRECAVVRGALHAQAPARVRLRALLFPPSTIRWAASGIGDRVTTALDRVDDAISAATRPLRRVTR